MDKTTHLDIGIDRRLWNEFRRVATQRALSPEKLLAQVLRSWLDQQALDDSWQAAKRRINDDEEAVALVKEMRARRRAR